MFLLLISFSLTLSHFSPGNSTYQAVFLKLAWHQVYSTCKTSRLQLSIFIIFSSSGHLPPRTLSLKKNEWPVGPGQLHQRARGVEEERGIRDTNDNLRETMPCTYWQEHLGQLPLLSSLGMLETQSLLLLLQGQGLQQSCPIYTTVTSRTTIIAANVKI